MVLRPAEKFSRPLPPGSVLGEGAELEAGGSAWMQEVVASESGQRESPPTSWPTGMIGMDVLSFAEWLRRAQAFNRGSVDEAAEPEIEEGAQLDELLHAHLALPMQDVPQPLSVNADTTSKLGYADASFLPFRLYEVDGFSTIYCKH